LSYQHELEQHATWLVNEFGAVPFASIDLGFNYMVLQSIYDSFYEKFDFK